MKTHKSASGHLITIVLLTIGLFACSPATPTQTLPTVTPFPSFQFVPPTEAPSVVTVGAVTVTVASNPDLDPEKLKPGNVATPGWTAGRVMARAAKEQTRGQSWPGQS